MSWRSPKNFARTLNAHVGHLPKRKQIEVWFQDEARIGQKNGIVDAAGEAWHRLVESPLVITSIGSQDWAHIGQR